MVPWHIASGMSGAVMVLPRGGLKDGAGKPLHYDRVYYIGEQDFYVPRDAKGKFKTYDSHGDAFADTMEVMRKLVPTHVVFNGAVGALTGKHAMPAKVGETVLIVHSQADRDSRAHLVGGHGDYVWETGKFSNPPETDLETWFIRGGSAGAALYKFLQPGIVAYVNHNMIEAFELGATAHFRVEGTWNDDLMTQVKAPEPIQASAAGNAKVLSAWAADRTVALARCHAAYLEHHAPGRRGRRAHGDLDFASGHGPEPAASRVQIPDLVELRPGAFDYRATGEFSRDGKPVTAPIVTATIKRTLAVMRHQVTAADYRRCVEAQACPMVDRDAVASDRPVVKVSWRDAHAYASWLSRETGAHFRLPTDEEWAYAAAGRFNDDALPESSDGSDPGQRALAIYDRDASREEVIDKAPQTDRQFRRERERPPRCGRQCLGMDRHLLRAQRARCARRGRRDVGQLRGSRRRGPSSDLHDGLHPRCACGRLLGRHAAEQSWFPACARSGSCAAPAVGMDAASPVDRCRGAIPTTDILRCRFHDDRFGVINGPDDPKIRLPLFPRKRTQVGCAISVSCRFCCRSRLRDAVNRDSVLLRRTSAGSIP